MEIDMNYFVKASPVWAKGKSEEMNYPLCFKSQLKKCNAVLYLASTALCRVTVNGEFVSCSPARAAHGFCRVDVINLEKYLTEDANELKIYAIGYFVNSFEYAWVKSSICAEVRCGNEVLCATGDSTLKCYLYAQKTIKTTRYSFQRGFCEVYDMTRDECGEEAELEYVPCGKFIDRTAPYPDYPVLDAVSKIGCGRVTKSEKASYFSDRCIVNIYEDYKGYKIDELDCYLAKNYQMFDCEKLNPEPVHTKTAALPDNSYVMFDMGREVTGFIEAQVICDGDTTLYAAWDELINDGDIDPFRLSTSSIVSWKLKKGTYKLSTLEPYCVRYLKFVTDGAGLILNNVSVRGYEFPYSQIEYKPNLKDGDMQKIFDAAVATFAQNSVDIFMDCPSRERAGWLCDSFFTSRVEYALTGKTRIEHDFLQNFIIPEKFDFIPEGMLPMCYPGDHPDHVFIPNYAMWFVIELAEYLERSGDRELIDAAKEKLYSLMKFFKKYENNDGLLQKLPSWVFIEWSKSNDFVQDISFPSNMVYSMVKRTIGEMYNDENMKNEGEQLACTIREHSYRNGFFADNALLDENGVAHTTNNFTESNQYYAFFTGIATPELYPELWKTLTEDFGPDRKKTGKMPEIYFANALTGNYLRLELLFRHGLHDKLYEEIKGYFLYMAEQTGTLWENDTDFASCNHGFASHVIYWLKGMGY